MCLSAQNLIWVSAKWSTDVHGLLCRWQLFVAMKLAVMHNCPPSNWQQEQQKGAPLFQCMHAC